jgi:hypothetical protein
MIRKLPSQEIVRPARVDLAGLPVKALAPHASTSDIESSALHMIASKYSTRSPQ